MTLRSGRAQQSGGPFNEQGEVVLLELRADPLLLPGDRVVLLVTRDGATLEQDAGMPVFTVLTWTGQYYLNGDGTLRPIAENPFAREVAGKTVDEFAAASRAVAAIR